MAAPAAVLPAQPLPAQPAQVEPADWGEIARQDVEAAYDLYVANHPGMHDPLNPGFPEQLKRARDAGTAIAATAADAEDYARALAAFTAELSDGHAQVFSTAVADTAAAKRLWPGFVGAWRGDAMVVHHAGAGFPMPVGSTVVSCDGSAMAEVVRGRFLGGFRPKEAGHWWARAPQTFMAIEGHAQDAPRICRFRSPGGQERELTLAWTPAPEDYGRLLTRAADGDRSDIGMSEPRPGIFLIGMPTFSPNPEEVKAYRALFEQLAARRGDLLNARAVVFDLRHNNGGSSSWSRQAGRVLWGAEPFDQRLDDYLKDVRIWWRASQDNVAYMSQMEAKVRADGNTDVADAIGEIGKGMKAALETGSKFYVEGEEKSEKTRPAALAASDFAAPVYLITPGGCASACLDAVDAFKLFANTRLIGAPTSADSTYMDVRRMALPSGKGTIVIPNKVWMGRPRRSGEVYSPDMTVTDVDWSTATFLDRIERDLSR